MNIFMCFIYIYMIHIHIYEYMLHLLIGAETDHTKDTPTEEDIETFPFMNICIH
jgi:hypothetical protein